MTGSRDASDASRAALFRLADRSDENFALPDSRRSVRIDIQPCPIAVDARRIRRV